MYEGLSKTLLLSQATFLLSTFCCKSCCCHLGIFRQHNTDRLHGISYKWMVLECFCKCECGKMEFIKKEDLWRRRNFKNVIISDPFFFLLSCKLLFFMHSFKCSPPHNIAVPFLVWSKHIQTLSLLLHCLLVLNFHNFSCVITISSFASSLKA